MSRKTLRFTPADIVRAIDGVEAAGVTGLRRRNHPNGRNQDPRRSRS
jgi:hypothetical protein